MRKENIRGKGEKMSNSLLKKGKEEGL